jgi:hypothetical protein
MLWKFVAIFLGGIVIDLLVTKYTRSVAVGERATAAALSGLITLINVAVLGVIAQHMETFGLYGALAFAGGSSLGTLLGFARFPGR